MASTKPKLPPSGNVVQRLGLLVQLFWPDDPVKMAKDLKMPLEVCRRVRRRDVPSIKMLQAVIRYCRVNREWLEFGRGEPFDLDFFELSEQVRLISRALANLSQRSELNRRAIITLLHDSTHISKRTIEAVLTGLTDLEKEYLRAQG